ncbi:DUF1127 domain-containing protein [Pseudohalocynthiibacter aestuariivivens]|uniref:DUF1127 domain-containing protein n=1 Tax=Roseovarius pelagicus TaxID=2980108 RepID=A0ABY6DDL4_9RHOB|nr:MULTISPECIES: DUF1127 domain-containing protein [Rhodobacterales]QIE44809.1 DUF1127 domain-containing protein [Pseudohalocynthiibacter aestuariivivens]UXX83283.1 DUF1127 domain-containing protein [Roseovarius pelagicus]
MTYVSHSHATCHPARTHGWTFSTLVALYRSRRALAGLSPEALADIGINRDAALREANRPAWDLPRRWAR